VYNLVLMYIGISLINLSFMSGEVTALPVTEDRLVTCLTLELTVLDRIMVVQEKNPLVMGHFPIFLKLFW